MPDSINDNTPIISKIFLSFASFKCMEIPINVTDKRILKFNNLQKDVALNTGITGGIQMQHDLELLVANQWLVHIDTWFAEPGKASIICRTTFTLTTAFENIWARGIAEEYVKFALATCRIAFNQECTEHAIDAALDENFASDQMVTLCLDALLEDVEANGLYILEDTTTYNWQTFRMPPGGDNPFVASVTVMALDEILLDNPAFNRLQNMETFNQYLPFRFYSTIKLKLMKLMAGETIFLNLKQFTIYIFMIRCSCTLLLSDHYQHMDASLQEKGFTENEMNDYIKAVATFLNDINDDLKSMGVSIGNWQDDIDWAALVK
jgi:hypothetical protein